MVGQPLAIKNSDPIMHNIHALPKVDGNTEFNFAQPSQGDVNDTKWVASITKPGSPGEDQMRRASVDVRLRRRAGSTRFSR